MGQKGEYQLNLDDAIAAGASILDTRAAGGLGPFSRLEWFALLAGALPPGERPEVVVSRREGASQWWMMATPSVGRAMHSLTNWYSFAWRPETCGDDHQRLPLACDAARELALRTGQLRLEPVREEDCALIVTALRRAGWLVEAEATGANHRLLIGDQGFEAWWAKRPGQMRSTVKRKGRDPAIAIRIERDFTDDDWAAFEAVYASSWKCPEGRPDLLRQFAAGEAARGQMRLGLLEWEGEVIAAQFWTVEGDTAFIHKLAHRPEHDRRSPGTLLTHALAAACVAEGVRTIDFGTGDDPYKKQWSDDARPLYTISAHNPRRIGAWPGLAKAAAKLVARRFEPRLRLASRAPVG